MTTTAYCNETATGNRIEQVLGAVLGKSLGAAMRQPSVTVMEEPLSTAMGQPLGMAMGHAIVSGPSTPLPGVSDVVHGHALSKAKQRAASNWKKVAFVIFLKEQAKKAFSVLL